MTYQAGSVPLQVDSSPASPLIRSRAGLAWSPFAAAYLLITLPLIGRFQYSLYPDATSYLSLAAAYARGEFWHAVNGYWAPLYCWLLAPLLAAGVDRLLAPKLLALVIGVATLAGISRIVAAFALPRALARAVLAAAVPSLAYWSVSYVTPDFLLVCVLTWYFAAVLDTTPTPPVRSGLTAGALGGLAYLAKQYAMPFVAAHLMLTAVLKWRADGQRPREVARWTCAAYLAFLAVSAPWVTAMSSKYDRLTISAAGTYNWYLHGPGVKGQYNVGTQGLVAPPFPGAVSAWVDPSTFVEYDAWRAESSLAATSHKVRQVLQTSVLALATLEKFTLLAVPLLIAGLLMAARPGRTARDLHAAYLALTVCLFFSGYVLIADEILERLVWISVVLLILLAARLTSQLGSTRLPPWTQAIVLAVIVGSFWLLPIRRVAQEIDDGRDVHALSRRVAGTLGPDVRVATLNRYADSLRLSFFTGASFHGRLSQKASVDEMLADLRRHRIDYLLIWSEGESPGEGTIAEGLRRRFPERNGGGLPEVQVLDVKGERLALR